MQRLLYVSYAAEEFSEPVVLNELVEDAIRRNKKNDITGALFYLGGYFIQLLEGSRDAVAETFSRINSDSRHTDVEVFFSEEVTERIFPGWNMSSNRVEIKGAPAAARLGVDALRQGIKEHWVTDCVTALEYFFAPRFER